MKNIDFTIDIDDLKCLFVACNAKGSFVKFITETEQSYSEYYIRNLGNPEKYGNPKTFSQWVNGQIIALT